MRARRGGWITGRNNHAVRDQRWRLIRYEDGGEELCDHQNDPREWNNLADDPSHAEIKRRLAEWLPENNAENAEFDPRRRGRKPK